MRAAGCRGAGNRRHRAGAAALALPRADPRAAGAAGAAAGRGSQSAASRALRPCRRARGGGVVHARRAAARARPVAAPARGHRHRAALSRSGFLAHPGRHRSRCLPAVHAAGCRAAVEPPVDDHGLHAGTQHHAVALGAGAGERAQRRGRGADRLHRRAARGRGLPASRAALGAVAAVAGGGRRRRDHPGHGGRTRARCRARTAAADPGLPRAGAAPRRQ